MTARWRYMVEDPLTGFVLAHDLPLSDVTLSESLNRPGGLTGRLPIADPHADPSILWPGRRAIYALRDGVIQWGGVLWTVEVPRGSDDVKIKAEGWLGYWDHRDIWRTRSYTQVEQFDIFAQLVADAQDTAGSTTPFSDSEGQVDLGIDVVWDAPSGVLRDRIDQYADHQSKNLGDALRELAAVDHGFDFSMEYTLGTETIGKAIRLHFPLRGRDLRGDLSHRFEFEFDTSPASKTNVIDRGVIHDASGQAWRIRGWGEGIDADRLRSQFVYGAAGAGYLPLDGHPTWGTVSEQSTLDGHTAAHVVRNARPVRIPSITVDPDRDPTWGTYGLGDIVPVDIIDRSPLSSYTGPGRIVGWSIDADQDRPTLDLEPVI